MATTANMRHLHTTALTPSASTDNKVSIASCSGWVGSILKLKLPQHFVYMLHESEVDERHLLLLKITPAAVQNNRHLHS